jgi:hypothetical protein
MPKGPEGRESDLEGVVKEVQSILNDIKIDVAPDNPSLPRSHEGRNVFPVVAANGVPYRVSVNLGRAFAEQDNFKDAISRAGTARLILDQLNSNERLYFTAYGSHLGLWDLEAVAEYHGRLNQDEEAA